MGLVIYKSSITKGKKLCYSVIDESFTIFAFLC